MVDFNRVISNLISIGVYDVLLPFILVYAIVFAILQKSKIFEGGSSSTENAKSVNAVVALVFGLFIVAAYNLVQLIQNLIINTIIVLIFILCVFIVIGLIFGDDYKKFFDLEKNKKFSFFILALAFLIILGILLTLLGVIDWFLDIWRNSNSSLNWDTIYTILAIFGIFGIMYCLIIDFEKGKEFVNYIIA